MTSEDNDDTAAPPPEEDTPNDDDEDESAAVKQTKRKERLEQNRVSARESRKRKKGMIEELQRTVITLSRENKELHDRNEQLRRQLLELGSKYPNLVPLQVLMGQAPQQVPPPTPMADVAAAAANTTATTAGTEVPNAAEATNATGV